MLIYYLPSAGFLGFVNSRYSRTVLFKETNTSLHVGLPVSKVGSKKATGTLWLPAEYQCTMLVRYEIYQIIIKCFKGAGENLAIII